ncbi:hypothetical protein DSO57_1039714 [Entomophthora muscae]|uniref:Uncharacterized protein n=2 Tax=Entomophthora muscae TaxID=34485 RepID=A0ACC2SCQ3_9FUNG|nr:hypothetical protein DSO57_1039714 [Entomophthora muscae]
MSTILQKLRAKEADSDRALGECQKKLGQSVKEVSDLKNKLNSLSSSEKTLTGSVRALNSKVDQLTKDKERLEVQVLKLKESEAALKGTLSKAQRDLKSLESESSKGNQEALSAAVRKEKQENQRLSDEVLAMKAQLEEIQYEAQQSILEMRQTLSRSQDEFSFREEELLKEIKDWQTSRFQYNITPVDADMDSIIEASKKPLLSELASLKDQFNQLQLKYNACERELKQCILQSDESKRVSDQAQLALSQERLAKEGIIENMEDSVRALQLKLQELQKALDESIADKNYALSRIEELQAAFKATNTKHTQELELLRKRYEFESPNLSCLQSPNAADMEFSGSPARISLDVPSLFSSNTPKSPAGEPIDFSDVRSEKSTHSLQESSQASFDAKLRSLQIQLAASIEARDHLSSDLIRVTSRLKQLEKNLVRLETLELEHKDLLLKHETALILLGEKEEQVSELKADIQEMKEEYRTQISELVAKLNKSPE